MQYEKIQTSDYKWGPLRPEKYEEFFPIAKSTYTCEGVEQVAPLYVIPFYAVGELMQIIGTLEIIPYEPAQGWTFLLTFMCKGTLMGSISDFKIFGYSSICFTSVVVLPGDIGSVDNIFFL